MEYAMCTLITGKRNFNSLFGVTNHELAHTWFQFLLASNESKHPWMDEGFTVYISNKAGNEILGRNRDNPHGGSYVHYKYVVKSNAEEPSQVMQTAITLIWPMVWGVTAKGTSFYHN